jgi:hypothetical protein
MERTWEHAERPTRPKGSAIDGVGIVAILEKPGGITQFSIAFVEVVAEIGNRTRNTSAEAV